MSGAPSTGKAKSVARRAGIPLSLLLLAVAIAVFVQRHRRARVERDTVALDALASTLIYECRRERPAIGGPTRDCDARAELHSAVTRLFTDARSGQMRDAGLRELLAEGAKTSPDVADFIERHEAELISVRESSRCARACDSGRERVSFRQGTEDDALRLLLLAARAGPPDRCLATALDVERVTDDSTTGIGILSLLGTLRTNLLEEAERVLWGCARLASAPALTRAALDATAIADDAAPVGDALATASVLDASRILETVANPRRQGGENVLWIQRGYLIDAAERRLDFARAIRAYKNDELPELFERLEHALPQSPWVPFATYAGDALAPTAGAFNHEESASPTLTGKAKLLRHLRFTSVALAAFRDRATTGSLPAQGPRERALPSLRDALTGQPFVWSGDFAHATLSAAPARGAPAQSLVF